DAVGTTANRVCARRLGACRDRTGKRWVITAWERCSRSWGNPPCPCLHSDPRVPDCPPGQTKRVAGWLSFYQGADIDGELRRLRKKGIPAEEEGRSHGGNANRRERGGRR